MNLRGTGVLFLLLALLAASCTLATGGLGGSAGLGGSTGRGGRAGSSGITGSGGTTGLGGSAGSGGSTGLGGSAGSGGSAGMGTGGQGGSHDPTAPTVTSTSPTDGAQAVAIDSHVEATFGVAMDPSTITAATFTVAKGAVPISGIVTYSNGTATFAPTMDYSPKTQLTATLTTGAKNQSGDALGEDYVWSFETGAKPGLAPVALGLASPFAVLASDGVTNTASVGTLVTGDVGISPGTSLTGFPPGVIVGGMYKGAAAAAAQADLLAAYDDAVARLGAAPLPADIAGLTFTPGLYAQVSAVALSTGSCTLDALGDADAVFIFQIGTSLGLAASTEIILSGNARAANIYWAVGTSAGMGAGAKFKGTILAATAITLGAGATVEGRLLAHGASVTLNTDVVGVPVP